MKFKRINIPTFKVVESESLKDLIVDRFHFVPECNRCGREVDCKRSWNPTITLDCWCPKGRIWVEDERPV